MKCLGFHAPGKFPQREPIASPLFSTRCLKYTTIGVMGIIFSVLCIGCEKVPGISSSLSVDGVQLQVKSAQLVDGVDADQSQKYVITGIAAIKSGDYVPVRETDALLNVVIKVERQSGQTGDLWDKHTTPSFEALLQNDVRNQLLTVQDANGHLCPLLIRGVARTTGNPSFYVFDVSKSAKEFTLLLPDGQTIKLGSVLEKKLREK